VVSPFGWAYLSALGGSPAALAFYPLLGLGLVSFLLVQRGWRWQRFLPWAAVLVLAVLRARTVPFFAVVAGPVLAWNLHDFFARRTRPALPLAFRLAAAGVATLLAAAFLVSAWPGWLQRPPFGPRQWAVKLPAGPEQAAAAVRRGYAEQAWPPGSRTLHLSSDTAAAFAWFCPDDDGVFDPQLASAATNDPGGADERLATAGVGRVVVDAADRGMPRVVLTRLLADPDRWPVLHLEGGVAVFGRRDPSRAGGGDPARGRELDLDRLAFRPTEGERAPPDPPRARRWWEGFWKSAPPPAVDRDQAAVLLLRAELGRASAPGRHLAEWEAEQAAAVAVAAAGWAGPAGAADAALRLTVFRPPVPGPGGAVAPITRYTFDSQRLFALARDDAPLGVLYAAVRAARRAVAADPADASAHLLLGQCYLRLLTLTRERVWAVRLPQLAELRQAQASAALNRALRLNPDLSRAHLELGRLYQRVGCLDLALDELRAYRAATGRAGADPNREGVSDAELDALARVVHRQRAEFAPESVRARVAIRARAAMRRGLAGEARKILLESDVSAFGSEGAELELDLLLRTGRAEDVRDWSAADLRDLLGTTRYHWLRTQALAALGDYAAADAELTDLAGDDGPAPARAGTAFAALTGRALLDEQPGRLDPPAVFARVSARQAFWSGLRQAVAGLAERADATVLRGLLALEAGDVGRARTALRAALACSPQEPGGGGLDFQSGPVARGALGLVPGGDGPPAP
jgi:tetratricopeptide (TPR) repeat protein